MKVLSLFDGLSACHLALTRAGHKVSTYYTSEVDKYAQEVSLKNIPNQVQLGDVQGWKGWELDWTSIDLVTGGFPCPSFSLAGNHLGDKDPRGSLFWTMLDVISKVLEHNPKAKFLIENVKMKAEFEAYVTHHTEQALGKVHKHLINSALVSAQNRRRFYWTNIEGIEQPEDKGLLLQDVLEDGFTDRNKSYLIDANYFKGGNLIQYFQASRRQVVFTVESKEEMNRLLAISKWEGAAPYRKLTPLECERLQTLPEGWTEGVSNTQRYKMLGNAWTVEVIAHIFKYL